MNKKNMKLPIIICVCVLVAIFLFPKIIGYIGGILYCNIEDLTQQYAKKSTDLLLRDMNSLNWRVADVAYGVLVDRKEKKAVQPIIKIMNKNPAVSEMYMKGLVAIGDERAIPAIYKLFKKYEAQGIKSRIYTTALLSLSEFHYEPIWPTLTQLSKSKKVTEMNLAIGCFARMGDKKALPILEQMRQNILKGDYIKEYEYEKSLKKNFEVTISASDIDWAIGEINKNNNILINRS